jgi:hypothetical protein
MPIDLDAGTQPPKGVDAPSHLTVFVGDPPRQLLIFSGVALPEWKSDEDLDREEVHIRLGATTTQFFTWTAQAALASISNEDSDFIFAVDGASVDVDPADGVLRLRVPIAVQGEPAILHRFSYTVHVLSDPIQAKIAGIISWARSWGDPTNLVAVGGTPMFRVAIGQTVTLPGTPGMFPQTKFVEQTAGFSSMPVASGDRWLAAYEIDDVPLGQMWEVRPALLGGTLGGPPSSFDAAPGFQPFPQMVQLSLAQPSASGVDFSMSFSQGPR